MIIGRLGLIEQALLNQVIVAGLSIAGYLKVLFGGGSGVRQPSSMHLVLLTVILTTAPSPEV